MTPLWRRIPCLPALLAARLRDPWSARDQRAYDLEVAWHRRTA